MNAKRNILRESVRLVLAAGGLMIVATLMWKPVALAQVDPIWIVTGSLNTPRNLHTATLLPNGKVLVAGGTNSTPGDSGITNSAELYDPATRTWSLTGSLNTPRVLHTATLLPNGKVLVAGGITNTTPPDFGITNSAELYDPATGTWSLTGSLNIARFWYTATLLPDGKVLIAGGWDGNEPSTTGELYDPNTGTWSITGSLVAARYGQTATLLQNGKVLVAGGSDDGDLASTLASTELYDPATGTWSLTGNLNASRIFHTATLLPNGKVLVGGGYTVNWVPFGGGGFASSPTSLNGAELYDPATGTWSGTGSLNIARDSHTATLLPDGKVLVAAGGSWTNTPTPCGLTATCSFNSLNNAELYDLLTGTWSGTASLNTARSNYTATLLATGTVLVAGGCNVADNTCNFLNSAELYESHLPAPVDFDGDGKSDVAVYQTSSGNWFFVQSTSGFGQQLNFGGSSSLPVPGDYDGDGAVDTAVYETSTGNWFVVGSTAGFFTPALNFGGTGFIPAPGDYDGDGNTDVAVYQASTGNWFVLGSTAGFFTPALNFGGSGFIPVPGDYDGDGKTDTAVYQQSTGNWFVVGTSTGFFTPALNFGGSGFLPVSGDYDGDGKADPGVYQSSTGNWFAVRSTAGFLQVLNFGGSGFIPVPGDYDGDGKTDAAVYGTTTGNWFVVGSTAGFFTPALNFGGTGFVPVLLQVTILRALALL